MLYSSGGKSVENDVIFDLSDKQNLTIEGNGSDFVFCDRIQPFFAAHSSNLTLRNFTMDYSFLRYAFARVEEIREDGLLLSIDEKFFDYRVENGNICFVCGSDVLSSAKRKISVKGLTPDGCFTTFWYVGDTTAPLNYAAQHVLSDAVKVPGGVFFNTDPKTKPCRP